MYISLHWYCEAETASQHPAVCVRSSPAVTCCGIGADEAWLWQCHTGRAACRSAWQAAVGAKCSSATNLLTSEVRSGVTVASARAYHLPVGSSCLPMLAQHGTALPHCLAPTGEQCWLPAVSTLVVVGHASDVPRTEHVTIGGHAFNCSSCVEQFASGNAVFWVTGHFSMPTKNWTVRAFLQLTPCLWNDFTGLFSSSLHYGADSC